VRLRACPLRFTTTQGVTMQIPSRPHRYQQEQGAIGYILLWFLGVPASVLFVIFLLRGCT
jgi:hypothetical protein